MKVTLVQPPLLRRSREDLNPPLGLLSLGAVLREESVDVDVLDLNLKGFQQPESVEPSRFYDLAVEAIEQTNPDVVGFTSMGLESHVCLRLAELLKQRDPAITTVFGGPHFSSIATQTLERFPWTDYVVTGAAEAATVDLVRHLRGRNHTPLVDVANRSHGGIALERSHGSRIDLNDLPFPAHDLVNVDDYFAINPLRMLCLEHARGCQLRCSFCYSEAHWGHGERVKRIDRVVAELTATSELGAGLVFFVADNFLTSKAAAIELCDAIADARLPVKWKCYATLAQLTPPVVEAMARAGCISVFVGVDAVSETNRRELKKTYYRGWERLRGTLELCMSHGVQPTCSFMLTPTDTHEGLNATLRSAVLTRALGGYVCINALGLYNGTALEQGRNGAPVEYSSLKPALVFDTPEVNVENPYARREPALFPFHQRQTLRTTGHDLSTYCHVAQSLTLAFPLALARYSLDAGGDLADLVIQASRVAATQLAQGQQISAAAHHENVLAEIRSSLRSTPTATTALECETILRHASDSTNGTHVLLEVDGVEIPCQLNGHEVIFYCAPDRLHRLVNLEPDDSPVPHVVVSHFGELNCLRMTSALRKLTKPPMFRSCLHRVRVPFATYQALLQTGVVIPVFVHPQRPGGLLLPSQHP